MELTHGTPVTQQGERLWVKHEEQCCPGGPPIFKMRGLHPHVSARNEHTIGVLDASLSRSCWATAYICREIEKRCVAYYPVRKADRDKPLREPTQRAQELGALLAPLPAGRNSVLYAQASRDLLRCDGNSYMIPNGIKIPETVSATAGEVEVTPIPSSVRTVLVSVGTGTLLAGVYRGLTKIGWRGTLVGHLGYHRHHGKLLDYVRAASGVSDPWVGLKLLDEDYKYEDEALGDLRPEWPCSPHFERKALSWWVRVGQNETRGGALLWNGG